LDDVGAPGGFIKHLKINDPPRTRTTRRIIKQMGLDGLMFTAPTLGRICGWL